NTDASWTVYVGDRQKAPPAKLNFLRAGEEALGAAIAEAWPGRKILDISAAMQRVVEGAGYTPVDTLVGHGVGKELHEDPQIPCLVMRGPNPEITTGMALAIEVIYTGGSRELKTAADGWTIETADKSWGGLFEYTVAVTDEGPIILTDLE
ncbi:MAG: M24 family metallopeptidase, partial [Patescibacteria group bacterium]